MNCALPMGAKIDTRLNEITKHVKEAYQNTDGYMICAFRVLEGGRVQMTRFNGNWDKNKHFMGLEAFVSDMLRVPMPEPLADLGKDKLVFDSYEDVLKYVEEHGRDKPTAGADS